VVITTPSVIGQMVLLSYIYIIERQPSTPMSAARGAQRDKACAHWERTARPPGVLQRNALQKPSAADVRQRALVQWAVDGATGRSGWAGVQGLEREVHAPSARRGPSLARARAHPIRRVRRRRGGSNGGAMASEGARLTSSRRTVRGRAPTRPRDGHGDGTLGDRGAWKVSICC
jgi:hypothetical protein